MIRSSSLPFRPAVTRRSLAGAPPIKAQRMHVPPLIYIYICFRTSPFSSLMLIHHYQLIDAGSCEHALETLRTQFRNEIENCRLKKGTAKAVISKSFNENKRKFKRGVTCPLLLFACLGTPSVRRGTQPAQGVASEYIIYASVLDAYFHGFGTMFCLKKVETTNYNL